MKFTINDIPELRAQLRNQTTSIEDVIGSLRSEGFTEQSSLVRYWSEAATALRAITEFPLPNEVQNTRKEQFVAAIARRSPRLATKFFPYEHAHLEHIDRIYMETASVHPRMELTLLNAGHAQIVKELIEDRAKQYVRLVCAQYRAAHLQNRNHSSHKPHLA